jgi:uncharacterized membrane protein YhaH (DUF805 family)
MDFQTAIKTCFQKYATFTGRASRSEFWWFALFTFLVSAALGMVSQTLQGLFSLAVLVPSIAVGVRRLHDIGKSGWFMLIWLIPFVGWIIMIYWACQPSTASNEWGEPAAALPAAATATPPGAV